MDENSKKDQNGPGQAPITIGGATIFRLDVNALLPGTNNVRTDPNRTAALAGIRESYRAPYNESFRPLMTGRGPGADE